MPQRVDLLAHGAAVADNPAGPFQHPLPLRGKAWKTRPAIDQQHAHPLFELVYSRAKCWLGDPATFGRPAKMPFAGKGKNEFKLVYQWLNLGPGVRFANLGC